MTKRIVFGVTAVALAVLVMAPSASAACTPAKNAVTYIDSSTASYWLPATVAGDADGQAWQLGAPGSFNSAGGAVPCAGFVYFSAAGANLNLNLGGCGAGCPATGSTLAVLALNKTTAGSEFLIATVAETPSNPSANFDYASQGSHNMVAIPRPRVLASSRAASNINLNVAIDSVAGGLYGPGAASAISGFRILAGQTPTAATNDLGRDAASYPTVIATIPSAGGAAATQAVVVNCSDITKDQWLVTQIQLENGTVLSNAVGGSTRVRCNQALANPDPKFKIIKKGLGTGTVKN